MRIRILYKWEDRDQHPRQVVVFAPGRSYTVTRRQGERAISAGKAVEVPVPNRDEAKNQ